MWLIPVITFLHPGGKRYLVENPVCLVQMNLGWIFGCILLYQLKWSAQSWSAGKVAWCFILCLRCHQKTSHSMHVPVSKKKKEIHGILNSAYVNNIRNLSFHCSRQYFGTSGCGRRGVGGAGLRLGPGFNLWLNSWHQSSLSPLLNLKVLISPLSFAYYCFLFPLPHSSISSFSSVVLTLPLFLLKSIYLML